MADLASAPAVQAALGRQLNEQESTRAAYLLGRASRLVRRRWPDVDDRIADVGDDLTAEAVADVVVELVLDALDPHRPRGARSWSVQSGAEGRTVTLGSSAPDGLTIQPWMVDVFEGPPGASSSAPRGDFPPAPRWPDPALPVQAR